MWRSWGGKETVVLDDPLAGKNGWKTVPLTELELVRKSQLDHVGFEDLQRIEYLMTRRETVKSKNRTSETRVTRKGSGTPVTASWFLSSPSVFYLVGKRSL